MFVFDLETYNNQQLAEAYAAGLNDVNRSQDQWNRDLTLREMETETENAIVFDKSCGNSIMNMPQNIWENYEGDESTDIDKDGDEVVSSYRFCPHIMLVDLTVGLYWNL